MNDDPPYMPARDVKVERAIGRFIIAWGALEREINSAIHDLLLTNLRTSAIVTANLAVKAKLDLAHALFEQLRAGDDPLWHPVPPEWESRFDALINRTAQANAESRIRIVHSQPSIVRFEDREIPFYVRMTARKGGLRGSGITYNKAYLDEQTNAVTELVGEWAAARTAWQEAVGAFRSADAEEWLGRSPGEKDHLLLQLQSARGSAKPNPKRPPSKPPSTEAIAKARQAKKKPSRP